VDAVGVHQAASRSVRRFRSVPAVVQEELAQEAVLRTLIGPAVRHPAAFAGQVARRLAIDWLRRPREVELGLTEHPDPGSLERELEARSVVSLLARELRSAPARHREVIRAVASEVTVDEQLAHHRVRGSELGRARDVLYKRRRRALGWLRARLA
jgi:DNA-directed RNA polymerase specialized sigma24 family protein